MANGLFYPQPVQAQTPDFSNLMRLQLAKQQQEQAIRQFLLQQQAAQTKAAREEELHPLLLRQKEAATEATEQATLRSQEELALSQAREQRAGAKSFLETGQTLQRQQFQEKAEQNLDNLLELRNTWAKTKNPIDEEYYHNALVRNVQLAGKAGYQRSEVPFLDELLREFTEATKPEDIKPGHIKKRHDRETGRTWYENIATGETIFETETTRRPMAEAEKLIEKRGEVQEEVAVRKAELSTAKALKVLERGYELKKSFAEFKKDLDDADFTGEQIDDLHDAAAALLEKDSLTNVEKATVKKNLGILNTKAPEVYSELIDNLVALEDKSIIERAKSYAGEWKTFLFGGERETLIPRRGKQPQRKFSHLYE